MEQQPGNKGQPGVHEPFNKACGNSEYKEKSIEKHVTKGRIQVSQNIGRKCIIMVKNEEEKNVAKRNIF